MTTRHGICKAVAGIALSWSVATAAQSDPGGARAQLAKGYALKQQGNCADAIPYFEESIRLDRTPKGLLNLADCEEKTGRLLTAQSHFVEARDLARQRGMNEPASYAQERAQALDKRLPRIAIRLAADAPAGTVVTRDGVQLGPVSLGAALPVDPGPHVIIARGDGFERTFEVAVVESETREIEVTPRGGTPLADNASPVEKHASPSIVSAPQPAPVAAAAPVEPERPARTGQTARTMVLAGEAALAAAGLAVAVIYELKAADAQDDADSLRDGLTRDGAPYPCDATSPPADCGRLNSKLDDRNAYRGMSRMGAIAAGAGAVAFVATWFLWRPASEQAVRVRPAVGLHGGGVTFDWRY